MAKRKGIAVITLEKLKELLKLDDNEEITNLIRSTDDINRDTFTIIISANGESKHTREVVEGALAPQIELEGI